MMPAGMKRIYWKIITLIVVWVFTPLCVIEVKAEVRTSDIATVNVLVDADVLKKYIDFVGDGDVLAIKKYNAQREVAELILLQQMLSIGGYNGAITLSAGKSYLDILQKVADGKGISYSSPAWFDDVYLQTEKYYVSEPMIRKGEFIVGLYVLPSNKKALSVNSLAELRRLRALSNSNWQVDWRTLQAMNFEVLYDSSLWSHSVKMLLAGRADFILVPFQASNDLSMVFHDMRLVPIPNMRLALDSSRHWAISRKHPQGEAVYGALTVGLAVMQGDGRVQQAYRDCGFFDPRVESWSVVNHR